MLLTFTGCLRFENSMDLSVPLKQAGPGGTSQTPQQQGVYASTQVGTDTASAIAPTENTGTPAENSTHGSAGQPGEDVSSSTGTTRPGETTTRSGDNTAPGTTTNNAPETTTANTANPTQSSGDTQSVAAYAASLGNTEYDILRTNNFTIRATMTDENESQEMNMSVANDEFYFTADMDGLEIGLYVTGQKTYIYYPPEKKYLKLSAAVARIMGLNTEDFTEMAESLGFDKLPALTQAQSMRDGTMDGTPCKVFFFKNVENGSDMQVYMNGTKILAVEYLDTNGKTTSITKFSSVSAGFPKMPPDGYEEIGYMKFLEILYNAMGT